MISNSRGFSAVTLLLLIVVVAITSGTGYYLYSQSNKEESDNISQNEKQEESSETKKTEQSKNAFPCGDDFEIVVPEGWYSGVIENGLNCFLATQENLPPQGKLTGSDISFVFETTPDTVDKLDVWADKFFENSQKGDYPITVTNKEEIAMNNGDRAVLVSGYGGHTNNEKNQYFFYKKGSLGIMTSWDASVTQEALRNEAITAVKSIR